jgi:hypothetical protein
MARLVRVGVFVRATGGGYHLVEAPDEVSIATILSICDQPSEDEVLHVLSKHVLEALSLTMLGDLY